ncbi:MAG: macro domain-containing protein [Theionarchaea archaeon]|nr:macro domain-containing protein [Theionarchaea archaeon]
MDTKIAGTEIQLVQGDITDLDTDAIVNAANSALKMGGGVAGAIRRRGGPEIQKECEAIGGTQVGGAVLTTGGNLKARYIIHAVGPMMGEGDEDGKLHDATLNSLRIADEVGLTSIAFPAISTGIFGYPVERCSRIMLGTVLEYLMGETALRRIVFCLYNPETFEAFEKELEKIANQARE